MRAKFNNKSHILGFGKYGQLHLQKGSTLTNKENGLLDTDIIAGLMTYIAEMNKQHKNHYNILALNNLQSAFVFLRLRRLSQHFESQRKNKHEKK